MMTIRPATREDIAAFSDMANKPTVKAWVGEVDGRLALLGGLALINGRWVAFCDITDAARRHKVTVARTAIMVMDEARKMGLRYVYANVDETEPRAERWLESLGFVYAPRAGYTHRWGA